MKFLKFKLFVLLIFFVIGDLSNANEVVPARLLKNHNKIKKTTFQGGFEGWTYVNFIINENGQPQSPIIIKSGINKRFASKTLKYLKLLEYTPATMDGKAVSSHASLFLKHKVGSKDFLNIGIGPGFSNQYAQVMNDLAKNDLESSHASVALLEQDYTKNLAEQAWLAWAKSIYYFKLKQYDSYYHNLLVAAAFTDDFLQSHIVSKLYVNLFEIQMYQGRYIEALKTIHNMANSDKVTLGDDVKADFTKRVNKALNAQDDILVQGKIHPDLVWQHSVQRPKLVINVKKGKLTQVDVRCLGFITKYVAPIPVDLLIEVQAEQCKLLIAGLPESEFSILESYSI